MERLPKNLREMYEFDRKQLPHDNEFNGFINYTDVLSGYYYLVDYFTQPEHDEQMLPGMRSKDLLASALHRQVTSFGGVKKYNTIFHVAASLFFGLIKNHAFHDGNKRIALLMMLHYLRKNSRCANCRQVHFEDLTVAIAGSEVKTVYASEYLKFESYEEPEIEFIAWFIKQNTRNISSVNHSITYRELKKILNNHGYDICNPDRNAIELHRIEKVKRLLGLLGDKYKSKRIFSIPFPSWTRQVAKGDLKKIREITNLDSKNGYDSMVFFGNNEPIYKLIHDFEGPLRRLKDR